MSAVCTHTRFAQVRTAGTLLKRCEGDCNADSDCSGGLKCIQRSALEPVPGCIAGGEGDVSGHDYCSGVPASRARCRTVSGPSLAARAL